MDRDAWGLEPVPTDPPALDTELGLTCDEDAPDWGPAQIRVAAPVTRAFFILTLLAAGMSWFRVQAIRTGIHRHKAR
jgi:hypothetical protein